MEITAQTVKDLRERTGLPMMECKQALAECKGDVKEAIEWLRKKHKGKLSEREGRATGEGWIGVYIDDSRKFGALVELQCETAPVAKNEIFQSLANAFARKVAKGSQACPDAAVIRKDPEMDSQFTEVFGKLREAMNLTQCRRIEGGYVAAYVHHDGKSGVMLALDKKPTSTKNVANDLCMHALFTNPAGITRNDVPADQVEKVRSEAREVAKAEGKPAGVIDKIAEGKVNAFFAERVLLEQLHVKTDDYGKAKVGDVLNQAGVGAVTALTIMKVGGAPA
jgi:elongation factor Ts